MEFDAEYILVGTIQRFCLHDGPGIRTTVFLQGCGLNCWWCHNPGLKNFHSLTAKSFKIDALIEELEHDAIYWKESEGGVTLSGGEPLYQSLSVNQLVLKLNAKGYHTAIETSGITGPSSLLELPEHVNMWLLDLKTVNSEKFYQNTGGELSCVLATFDKLLEKAKGEIVLRIPIIKNFNDDKLSLEEIKNYIKNLHRKVKVEILPGHNLGIKENAKVGLSLCNKFADDLLHSGIETEVII